MKAASDYNSFGFELLALQLRCRRTVLKPSDTIVTWVPALCLDVVSCYSLRPVRPSEEASLFHRASGDPADHRVRLRDASTALREDGLPASADAPRPCQVRP